VHFGRSRIAAAGSITARLLVNGEGGAWMLLLSPGVFERIALNPGSEPAPTEDPWQAGIDVPDWIQQHRTAFGGVHLSGEDPAGWRWL
jgi:hypothetical protein